MVDIEQAKAWVASRLSHGRLEHSLRVADEAVRLAVRWGADAEKAKLAGVLHDVARELPYEEMRRIVAEHDIEVTDQELQVRELLHAPVGAFLVRHELGLDDDEVWAAIRYHTTGRAGMSLLEKVVYLADYIEPGRNFPGVDQARRLAEVNLDEAVFWALNQTIDYLAKRGTSAHPFTVEARNALQKAGLDARGGMA